MNGTEADDTMTVKRCKDVQSITLSNVSNCVERTQCAGRNIDRASECATRNEVNK